MAKLGVITDGISRELEHALTVMNEFDLTQAELQFIWDKEVGDLDDAQMDRAQHLVQAHNVEVSCISRHIFGGLSVGATNIDDPVYQEHIAALHRCIDMAKALGCSDNGFPQGNDFVRQLWRRAMECRDRRLG